MALTVRTMIKSVSGPFIVVATKNPVDKMESQRWGLCFEIWTPFGTCRYIILVIHYRNTPPIYYTAWPNLPRSKICKILAVIWCITRIFGT